MCTCHNFENISMQICPLNLRPRPFVSPPRCDVFACRSNPGNRRPAVRTDAEPPGNQPNGARPDPSKGQQPADQPQFRVDDAVETVNWGGTLPSGRRAVVGGLSGLAIALIGNLGGITSNLLALDGGETAGRLGLDVIIPVAGYKRALNRETGYEFQYPAAWLADQALYRRAAEQAERQRPLDPPSLRQSKPERRVAEPQVAYGPAGSSGEENVSIIAAPILPEFRLEDLGTAEQAAQRFLTTTVAPPGSDREAELISATSRGDENGTLYYTLEFTVKSPRFYRHNLSVYASRGGLLYTLNVQCPQQRWQEDQAMLQPIPATFRVL